MCRFSARVHLCIAEGDGKLKDIVHKNWNNKKKQFKHNSKL
jgi:hypothetical protein